MSDERPPIDEPIIYMGQFYGWHFYAYEQRHGGRAHCLAVPPVDGESYTTAENQNPPDIRRDRLPRGTLHFAGESKAEAVYNAVFNALAEV